MTRGKMTLCNGGITAMGLRSAGKKIKQFFGDIGETAKNAAATSKTLPKVLVNCRHCIKNWKPWAGQKPSGKESNGLTGFLAWHEARKKEQEAESAT